jgi:hypothetical protein
MGASRRYAATDEANTEKENGIMKKDKVIGTLFAVSEIGALFGSGAIHGDAESVSWFRNGDLSVEYDYKKHRVTVYALNLTDAQFYAIVGYCVVSGIAHRIVE